MKNQLQQITLDAWDKRYEELSRTGLDEPHYGGPLSRHVEDGDYRLMSLRYDDSPAALRLWNFLLTEEDRLHQARAQRKTIIGTMKDLGTVPIMAYALNDVVAFYPDGAWWIPCVMEQSAGLLKIADSLGIDESFCPVRAMLGAFVTKKHFPIPDKLICSVGATCDDFSAIAQRLEGLGFDITWWEIPHRRRPDQTEDAAKLPGGFTAPSSQISFVVSELERLRTILEETTGQCLSDEKLSASITKANKVRSLLAELRRLVFTAERCPLPALEMLIAEMLAIHYCSDRDETIAVLEGLLHEVKDRISSQTAALDREAAKIFWINPAADLHVMNLLEQCGARVCGTDYMFTHALDEIPEDLPPLEALARTALADPMAGSAAERAERICRDIQAFGSEALLISRIPGASHCGLEGRIIADIVSRRLDIPTAEIEVAPITDSDNMSIQTRLQALVETVNNRRSV